MSDKNSKHKLFTDSLTEISFALEFWIKVKTY